MSLGWGFILYFVLHLLMMKLMMKGHNHGNHHKNDHSTGNHTDKDQDRVENYKIKQLEGKLTFLKTQNELLQKKIDSLS